MHTTYVNNTVHTYSAYKCFGKKLHEEQSLTHALFANHLFIPCDVVGFFLSITNGYDMPLVSPK